MALLFPPNVSVAIYRTASPGTPYTLGALSAAGVAAYLQSRVQTGRHGTAQWLKWTHILYVGPAVDVRDAYNTQLDPSRDDTLADTVIVKYSQNPAVLTAFYVSFVEFALRGSVGSHQRVYLDRFQPASWPTDAL